MSEVGKNQHQLKWIQALEAKFESDEKVVGRNIFDEILEKYTVSLCKTTLSLELEN